MSWDVVVLVIVIVAIGWVVLRFTNHAQSRSDSSQQARSSHVDSGGIRGSDGDWGSGDRPRRDRDGSNSDRINQNEKDSDSDHSSDGGGDSGGGE